MCEYSLADVPISRPSLSRTLCTEFHKQATDEVDALSQGDGQTDVLYIIIS